MNKILLLVLVFLFTQESNAQISLGAHYLNPNFFNWNKALTFKQGDPRYIYNSGFKVNGGYWFKLRKTRIEFNPALEYSRFSQKVKGENIVSSKENENFLTNRASFAFNVNIYFLDIKNDCDCPTINKDGNIFKKGLFVFVAPVVSYGFNKYSYKLVGKDESVNLSKEGLSYGGRVGMGFDIGVTKLMTITPMFSYGLYFDKEWEGLDAEIRTNNNELFNDIDARLDKTNQGEFSFGLRALFNFSNFYKYTRRSYR